MEAPEAVVYCGGGAIKRQIEYIILDDSGDMWGAHVTVNGGTKRVMTAYSYFGNNNTPNDFVVALLGEDRSEFLIFNQGNENWLEYDDYINRQCNWSGRTEFTSDHQVTLTAICDCNAPCWIRVLLASY